MKLDNQKAKMYCQEMMDETDNAPFGRYRSWWYCYSAFSKAFRHPEKADRDYLALSLAFYLASWGMYRGSSFLLQHDYKIHRAVVDYLLDQPMPRTLWESSRPQKDSLHPIDFYRDTKHVDMLIEACKELRSLYRANDPKASVTDTLATKILMGALGCTPAYDQYVVKSIKKYGLYDAKMRCAKPYSFIRKSIAKVSEFYFAKPSFYKGLTIKPQGFYYPPMKIMDMVLWEAS
jgi:hypothetical protein